MATFLKTLQLNWRKISRTKIPQKDQRLYTKNSKDASSICERVTLAAFKDCSIPLIKNLQVHPF